MDLYRCCGILGRERNRKAGENIQIPIEGKSEKYTKQQLNLDLLWLKYSELFPEIIQLQEALRIRDSIEISQRAVLIGIVHELKEVLCILAAEI